MARAMEKRTVGCTQLNEQSSRSHAVFTLRLEGVNDSSKLKVRQIKQVTLCDVRRLTHKQHVGAGVRHIRM